MASIHLSPVKIQKWLKWGLALGICFFLADRATTLAQNNNATNYGAMGAIAGGGNEGQALRVEAPNQTNIYTPRLGTPINSDTPTAYEPMPCPPKPPSMGVKALQAICWYLPNRFMDLIDIPRAYITIGDGMGMSFRLTKYVLYASWFEDDAFCIGWTKRKPLFFGEQVQERYFSFLAAREGKMDRDPTDVGLAVHLAIGGLNVAISGGELLDALAGWVGIDLMGDDHGPVLFRDDVKESEVQKRLQKAVYGPQEPWRKAPPPGEEDTYSQEDEPTSETLPTLSAPPPAAADPAAAPVPMADDDHPTTVSTGIKAPPFDGDMVADPPKEPGSVPAVKDE